MPASKLLIEQWLPIAEIGVESQREYGYRTPFPATSRLHIWWARRPLTASRAAVVGSLLPVWNPEWPESLQCKFPTESSYRAWFCRLMGIQGDPVAARRLLEYARASNLTLKGGPYGYPRAFSVNPAQEDLDTMTELIGFAWGTESLVVLDPMAGGGSIPFEALRYGFTTLANELNPVASLVLTATLDYPSRFGPVLAEDIGRYAAQIAERVKDRLDPFFPRQEGESIFAYFWARTVACPSTGKPVPLSPNWWLQKGNKPVAVRLLCQSDWSECRFEILHGQAALRSEPDEGTIRRGVAISPWTGESIDGDYIKREAQAGRMGNQLFTVAVKTPRGLAFRPPTTVDELGVQDAISELKQKLSQWDAKGWVPTEPRQAGRADWAAEIYGLATWSAAFSPRQLLAACTVIEEMAGLKSEILANDESGRGRAIATYLALAFDKAVDYNSMQVVWDPTRRKIAHAFLRHDFSFKWTFAEFDAAHNLMPWVNEQVLDAYKGIAQMAGAASPRFWQRVASPPVERVKITRGSASSLSSIPSSSVHLVCVDPPYYDNVQYAELSDYFYVWLKRTAGDLHPDWFATELVDKDEEAVANLSRFAEFGPRRKQLAQQDYERKMAAIFREIHRVLRSDGVLTLMFTHKQVEAWNTLATALIGAGFRIASSWPIHTESEHSLHQAKKNAASSTILLVCRKRQAATEPVWWDDLKNTVRRVARERASEFAEQGISGVDLYISAFGPALSVISEHWPVLTSETDEMTGEAKPLRPEVALDLARQEVISLRKQGLLLGRQMQFDPATDWYLMAWDAFKAEEFPADEARKLAVALGLDLEADVVKQYRLVAKKQSTVVVQLPRARRRNGIVDPDVTHFGTWLDAAHTAMLVYEEDGSLACEQFLKRSGLMTDGTFKACLQAMINAIPRTKIKGTFARPEAATLDRLRQAFFEDLVVPAEEAPPEPVEQQLSLLGESEGEDMAEEDEEE